MTLDLAPARNARSLQRLVDDAASAAWRIRDEDPAELHAELARMPRLRLEQLACVLAAMVDVDREPAELLAWTTAGLAAAPTPQPEPAKPLRSRRRCWWCADGLPFGGLTAYCSTLCRRASRREQMRVSKARARATVHSGDTACGPGLAETA